MHLMTAEGGERGTKWPSGHGIAQECGTSGATLRTSTVTRYLTLLIPEPLCLESQL